MKEKAPLAVLILFLFPLFLYSQNTTTIAKVYDSSISIKEFETAREKYKEELFPEESFKYVWEILVHNRLIEQTSEKAGLFLTKPELEDLLYGDRLSPYIREVYKEDFVNPITGEIDLEKIKQGHTFFENINYEGYNEEEVKELKELEIKVATLNENVRIDRLTTKYQHLLKAAVYTPSWMAKISSQKEELLSFDYVRIPYEKIDDTKISVSDQELAAYLKQHKKQYNSPSIASIEYLRFPIEASSSDHATILNELKPFAERLKTATVNKGFLLKHGGYRDQGFKKINNFSIDQAIKDKLKTASVGDVIGPYVQNQEYHTLKVLKKTMMPDAVSFSHILILAKTKEELLRGKKTLDSLKQLILEEKLSFEDAAQQYSEELASKHYGGALGWCKKDGALVEEFENFLFSDIKINALEIIHTEYGVHLAKITDKKFETKSPAVQLASFKTPIVPSKTTIQKVQEQVNSFVAKNKDLARFRAAAGKLGITLEKASDLPLFGVAIPALGTNRTSAQIIKWAHTEAKQGQVANRAFEMKAENASRGAAFIVPALIFVQTKDNPSLENPSLKAGIREIIIREKKQAFLTEQSKDLTSLDEFTKLYPVAVETFEQQSFDQTLFSNKGYERSLLARATNSPIDALSPVVLGKAGLYVLTVTSKKNLLFSAPATLNAEKRTLSLFKDKQLGDLEKAANIIDYRLDFYK